MSLTMFVRERKLEQAIVATTSGRSGVAEVIDHVAAAYILQGFLDRLKVLKS